jgi:hypothetical protein
MQNQKVRIQEGFAPSEKRLYNVTMSTLSADTHPKMEALQIKVIRRMPTWKKFAIVDGLNEMVKTLATTGIKQRNPHATPEQIHRMLAELMLGEELARKVYDRAR